MKNILLFIWQLPQNLLGLAFLCITRKKEKYHEGMGRWFYTYSAPRYIPGASLGDFIFLHNSRNWNLLDNRHEFGHSMQSRMLGPLYLILIAIPSAGGNMWDRIFHRKWDKVRREKWYYGLPWEAWADRLGGVNREYDY
jgi:hypothetical protein